MKAVPGRANLTWAIAFVATSMVVWAAPAVLAQEHLTTESAQIEAAADDAAPIPEESFYPQVFPVGGEHSFTDTFGAPRDGGRSHQGTDIFAAKLTPVLAAADGVVIAMRTDGPRAGVYIVIQHNDGWSSLYVHLNNDTPGTDDGLGTGFVETLAVGASVAAGEIIGFVGDSGNAEEVSPHLHFELHDPNGTPVNPFPHLVAAAGVPTGSLPSQAAPAVLGPQPQMENTTLVGYLNPGGGFNSDVWVVGDIAYLSSWGRPNACPAHGVRVIDVADPTQPEQIGTFADGSEFPGTSAEDLWAGPIDSPTFQGDLAVAAIRLCDTSELGRIRGAFRGLAIYDVTDPAQPRLLSTIDSGDRTQGVHELRAILRSDGRILVMASVPQSFLHHPEEKGDIRILDITDPFAPRELADWDFRRDAPAELVEPLVAARGDEELRGHGIEVAPDGMELYVGHWDAGLVRIDISEPEAPVFISATTYGEAEEGNAHSAWYDPDSPFMITNDEDLHPHDDDEGHVAGWGYQRIFDRSDPTQLVQVATFATENAVPGEDGEIGLDGFYTSHDVDVAGDLAVSSWYSDGARILDLTDLANPVEIGFFIPPPAPDPQGYWIAPDGTSAFAAVWGVQLVGNLVFASDINSGLWVFRIGEDKVDANPAGPGLLEANVDMDPLEIVVEPGLSVGDTEVDPTASDLSRKPTESSFGVGSAAGASW